MINIYATHTFKNELSKLIKNNSYRDLEEKLIKDVFHDNFCLSERGTVINIYGDKPLVKMRVGGSSGFRLYILVIKIENTIYLGYIHPKTGSKGFENINDDKKKEILKDIIDSIDEDELYVVTCCNKRKKMIFQEKTKKNIVS